MFTPFKNNTFFNLILIETHEINSVDKLKVKLR